jgi:hypothetical protein
VNHDYELYKKCHLKEFQLPISKKNISTNIYSLTQVKYNISWQEESLKGWPYTILVRLLFISKEKITVRTWQVLTIVTLVPQFIKMEELKNIAHLWYYNLCDLWDCQLWINNHYKLFPVRHNDRGKVTRMIKTMATLGQV